MKWKLLIIIVLLPLLSLSTSCQKESTFSNLESKLVKMDSGKAQMIGRVVDVQNNSPLVGIPVRLAQVYRQGNEGAFVLDLAHSPSAITNHKGEFVITDISPAEYLIVIGRPEENNYVIYQEKGSKPVTIIVEGGDIINFGDVKVNYHQ